MPAPSDSGPPASRFGFQWKNYRYEFQRGVVVHPDYEMLHLATRTFFLAAYPTLKAEPRLVEFKPFLPPYGRTTDLAYMAPELVRSLFREAAPHGDVLTPPGLDGRADVFSLGLVLLEMLLARHPLEAAHGLWLNVESRFPIGERTCALLLVEPGTLANRVLHFGPEELLHAANVVPEPLQRIVAKALRANPDERYSSASDMHNDLCCYLLGLKPAYGAKEVAEDASEILMHAAELEGVPAHAAFKQGCLPAPSGSGPESLN